MARQVLLSRRDWLTQAGVVFGGGNWLAPLTIITDVRPQTVAQALSNDPADTQFTIDLGIARRISLIHFQRFTVTALATVRVAVGNDPTFATNLYDTGIVSGWPQDKTAMTNNVWGELSVNGTYEPEEYTVLGLPRFFVPPSPVSARYIKVLINDSTSTTPTQIGVMGVCEAWEPALGTNYWDQGSVITWLDESDVTAVPYGSKYVIPRGMRRRLSLGFSWIGETDMWTILHNWVGMIGKSRPVVVVPQPDDTPNLEKKALYGLLSNDPAITNPMFVRYQFPLQVDQLI